MRRVVLLGSVCAIAYAGLAHAAGSRTGEPVVAVSLKAPGGDAVELRVQDSDGGGLCLDLAIDALARPDGACLDPPSSVSADLAPRILRADDYTVAYGATTAATHRLRLTFSSGRTREVAARLAPAYRGSYAGRVRFYAVVVSGHPALARVVATDGRGRIRLARDLNPMALPPARGRATLARLHDESNRAATLQALDARILAAGPGAPGRTRRALCVGLRVTDQPAALPGRSLCLSRTNRFDVRFASDCTARRTILYGVAPAMVRSVVATLGDGTRRTVALRAIPRRLGHPQRALLLEVADGQPTAATGYDASGKPIASVRLMGGRCS